MTQEFNNNSNQQQQPQVIVVQNESQTLAAIVAIFFGGIGHLVQGRMGSGLGWIFTEYILGITLTIMTLGLGTLLALLVRILCIVDAATYKPNTGKKVTSLLWIGMAINGAGILFALMFWGAAISGA